MHEMTLWFQTCSLESECGLENFPNAKLSSSRLLLLSVIISLCSINLLACFFLVIFGLASDTHISPALIQTILKLQTGNWFSWIILLALVKERRRNCWSPKTKENYVFAHLSSCSFLSSCIPVWVPKVGVSNISLPVPAHLLNICTVCRFHYIASLNQHTVTLLPRQAHTTECMTAKTNSH